MKRRENEFRSFVRYTLIPHGITLWEVPDGYHEVSGKKISSIRHVDLHGILTSGTRIGKYVGLELKIGRNPNINDLEETQIIYLNEVERKGGLALVGYINPDAFTMSIYGYASGDFMEIDGWQNLPLRRSI